MEYRFLQNMEFINEKINAYFHNLLVTVAMGYVIVIT